MPGITVTDEVGRNLIISFWIEMEIYSIQKQYVKTTAYNLWKKFNWIYTNDDFKGLLIWPNIPCRNQKPHVKPHLEEQFEVSNEVTTNISNFSNIYF